MRCLSESSVRSMQTFGVSEVPTADIGYKQEGLGDTRLGRNRQDEQRGAWTENEPRFRRIPPKWQYRVIVNEWVSGGKRRAGRFSLDLGGDRARASGMGASLRILGGYGGVGVRGVRGVR